MDYSNCVCLSEETLKAVGPLYLVSMPGEVYHTQCDLVMPISKLSAASPFNCYQLFREYLIKQVTHGSS